MSFLEPGGKVKVIRDGKEVEEIDVETEVTLINTNSQEYNSDKEADDVWDPIRQQNRRI